MFMEDFPGQLLKVCLTQESCTLLSVAILIQAANHPWCAGEFLWEHQGMEEEITDTENEATMMFLSSGISA